MRQTHMSLNRSLLFIVIVTPEMGHLLDLYKAQQQLLETTGATLSDEGSYPPVKPEFGSLMRFFISSFVSYQLSFKAVSFLLS